LAFAVAQRVLGIEVEPARDLSETEEQVAELFAQMGRIVRLRCALELGDLLAHLREHASEVRPVEADARGTLAELPGARQRRQRPRDAIECARGATRCRAFARLVTFPGLAQCHRVDGRLIAEDVRVAALELVADRGRHVLEREMSALFRDPRLEHDLEQHVAELVANACGIAFGHGVRELVRFLRACAARSSTRSAHDPTGSRVPDRGAGP
jgi:hypothetical protein